MALKAVFFDIDGTLVDSNEQHVTSWAFAFAEAGHPQDLGKIRCQIGKGGDLLVPALAPHLPEHARSEIAQRQGMYFKEIYLEGVQPFTGAVEIVWWVRSSGRMVVLASSAKREELDHYVELLGIGDAIAASTSIDDVSTSKPAPDIFKAALEKAGVAASEAIVVGDTIYDVEAAARSGIATIGLLSGPFDERALREAGAIAVFADVADLLTNISHSPLCMPT